MTFVFQRRKPEQKSAVQLEIISQATNNSTAKVKKNVHERQGLTFQNTYAQAETMLIEESVTFQVEDGFAVHTQYIIAP